MNLKDTIQSCLDAASELEKKLLKKRSRRASKKSCGDLERSRGQQTYNLEGSRLGSSCGAHIASTEQSSLL